ncbi:MAG: ComF family protein [Planctomycetaceae bacterium]|nr:ComF family protein [Planctomycetaceae bacterium]
MDHVSPKHYKKFVFGRQFSISLDEHFTESRTTNGLIMQLCSVFHSPQLPFRYFFDLFYPPVCPLCNELMENDELFCNECVAKLSTPDGWFCKRCGGKRQPPSHNILGKTSDTLLGCSRCRAIKFRFRRVIVLGEYEKELRELILRMKTDRSGFLARAVTQLLVRQRAKEFQRIKLDVIIPVPMYWFRRWSRGVNSPDILAEELGRLLNVPVAAHCVRRTRPTEVQYLLSAHNRASNVANAFALKKQLNWSKNCSKDRLKDWLKNQLKNWFKLGANSEIESFDSELSGKNVLLVDDIFTTGSTCNEIAKILRAAGVRNITVCAFARAIGFYTQRRANLLENLARKRKF